VLLGSSGGISPPTRGGFMSPMERLETGHAPHVLLAPWNVASLDRLQRFARDATTGSWVAISGNPLLDVADTEGAGAENAAARLLAALETHGITALQDVDGAFAIAWWNAPSKELRLIRDRFGAEPLYYLHSQAAGALWFASRVRDLVAVGAAKREICPEGLAQFLVYCYVPGDSTLHRGVRKVPPGKLVVYAPSAATRIERWYSLSFADPWTGTEREIADRYRDELEQAVTRRLGATNPGILLSGGMDSSSVAAFSRRHWQGPINTFGFRCAGASFDESYYARALATELGTEHREVDFGEQDSLSVVEAIEQMEVPFCDVGIEVGTWLLGGIARGHTEYLLTGDGGDEMWASHPVYAAQKLMRWYDILPLPSFIHSGLYRLASLVHDSDKKRNLPVIVKRILPLPGIPRDLRHFRWRMYYAPRQLPELATAAWGTALGNTDPLACVRESFAGYRGPDDGISPLLYSDYTTVTGFYFSRLLLCRRFGLEARMPFFDRQFVEFGARIPARLKLEGLERTKRLFRVAMQGVLPEVINKRTDKLGHSVPLKNWLRDRSILNSEVHKTLTRQNIEGRGLFRFETIERMMVEHAARRHNHSHRIWAMFVLETWLARHMS
jgi:asparagine synthase (glutamine-hydrolysing)